MCEIRAVVVVKGSACSPLSDDLSSNPAEACSFFCKSVFEKNENKQKEAGVGQLFKKNYVQNKYQFYSFGSLAKTPTKYCKIFNEKTHNGLNTIESTFAN